MSMRTPSQAVTLRDVSNHRRLSEPPEDIHNPSPNPDPTARGSKGKRRAFITEVIDEGPLGGNPGGDPDNPDNPGDDKLSEDNPDDGLPEDLDDLEDDMLMRRVFNSLAKPCQPEP
jgi:hypothetical protein